MLLGEMRDLDSIPITLSLAETGHLVFATLHTNDAAQALDRIIDVFPAERRDQIQIMLAGALQGVISPAPPAGRSAAVVSPATRCMVANEAIRNLVREGKSRQMRNMIATGAARRHADHRDGPRPPRGGRPHHRWRRRWSRASTRRRCRRSSRPLGPRCTLTPRWPPARPARRVRAPTAATPWPRRRHRCRRPTVAESAVGRADRRWSSRSRRTRTSPGSPRAREAGWCCRRASPGITVAAEEAFVLPRLFEVLDFRPTFEAAAINAPMGLFDTPSGQFRPCDHEAREYVGWPRVVAINGTPSREAIRASNGEARRMEPWMTKHDIRRLRWLREAEKELQPYHSRSFFSANPDVSFTVMNSDVPLTTSPYHEDGRIERLELIRDRLPGVDDVIDPYATRSARPVCTCCKRRHCCSPPAAVRAGRSAGCRSIRPGTTPACAWRSSAEPVTAACVRCVRVRATIRRADQALRERSAIGPLSGVTAGRSVAGAPAGATRLGGANETTGATGCSGSLALARRPAGPGRDVRTWS